MEKFDPQLHMSVPDFQARVQDQEQLPGEEVDLSRRVDVDSDMVATDLAGEVPPPPLAAMEEHSFLL